MTSAARDETRFEVQKQSVREFFRQDASRWQKVLPFLRGEEGLTLRLIDHFVTSYARKHVCETSSSVGGLVNVYHNMQTSLRHGMNKKRLDPFYRKHSNEAENVVMDDGTETNVGQLTFFRWAIVTGALDLVCAHRDAIRADMREVQAKNSAAKARQVPVHEVVIDLPPAYESEQPQERERIRVTLRERMQQPKSRRKRLREDKFDAVARTNKPVVSLENAVI